MSNAIQALQSFVYAIHPLTDEAWLDFASIWTNGTAKRKETLTTAGNIEKHLYFITEGVQRAFYLNDNDKEATLVFTYPFSFSGVADSFLTQTPSKYYFETLTQSTFLRTTYQQVAALMDKHACIERMIRKATAHALAGVLERQIELQCFSAEQKFKVLLNRSPHVLQLIPHKYLASYLGLDATTFSKLLSTVRL